METVNVFEGSRRIALIIKILWVVATALFTWMTSPHVSLRFVTHFPNQIFQKVTDGCDIGTDGIESFGRDIGDGKRAWIRLCFKARRADSGQLVVPYKVDSTGEWWGSGRYSSDVEAYLEGRAEAFMLTEADQRAALEEWTRLRWKNIGNGVFVATGGWIVLSLLQMLLGWIARGFLGIPSGQDRRIERPAGSAEAS